MDIKPSRDQDTVAPIELGQGLLELILKAIFIYFPAMASNGAPVFVRKGTPIDLGRIFIDGKRILGDGKTFEGFAVGVIFGTGVGAIYSAALDNPYFIPYSMASSIGALLGDMAGAFIKRRLGIPRGASAPILDQLFFYISANLLIKALSLDTIVGYEIDLPVFIAGAAIVMLLHVATNWGAYKLGLKNVPY